MLNLQKQEKTGFPHMRKGWLCESPLGWEDRGEVNSDHVARLVKDKRKNLNLHASCPRCWHTCRVGRELSDLKAFLYCPVCMEKVTKPYY